MHKPLPCISFSLVRSFPTFQRAHIMLAPPQVLASQKQLEAKYKQAQATAVSRGGRSGRTSRPRPKR